MTLGDELLAQHLTGFEWGGGHELVSVRRRFAIYGEHGMIGRGQIEPCNFLGGQPLQGEMLVGLWCDR